MGQHQFVPSGITGGIGGGIIMPSMGSMKSGSNGGASGHISPQWGWYISTTPPPVEKYPAANTRKKGAKDKNNISSIDPLSHPSYSSSQPMPVFKKSIKGSGRTHMEWS